MCNCAGTIISDRPCVFSNNILLYVMFQLYLIVDGKFRGHFNLKLSCFIVYLQKTGEILLLI